METTGARNEVLCHCNNPREEQFPCCEIDEALGVLNTQNSSSEPLYSVLLGWLNTCLDFPYYLVKIE